MKFEIVNCINKIDSTFFKNFKMPDPLENNIINKILLHVNISKLNIMEYCTIYETFLAYYSVGYILLYLILAILSWIAIKGIFNLNIFFYKEY
jgi:hypothetical protein